MSQKSITKRDAEILKAGREKEKDEKRVGQAQTMYSHTHVAAIGRELKNNYKGFNEANSRQSFAEAYQKRDDAEKGQIRNRAKQILMSKFEPGMDPNEVLYEGSKVTKSQLVDNYLDGHLLADRSTTASSVLQAERDNLKEIHKKKIEESFETF